MDGGILEMVYGGTNQGIGRFTIKLP